MDRSISNQLVAIDSPLVSVDLELEIGRLENLLLKKPSDLDAITQVANLYVLTNKIPKSKESIDNAFRVFKSDTHSPEQALAMIDVALAFWRLQKYNSPQSILLNMSDERKEFIGNIGRMLGVMKTMRDKSKSEKVLVKLAYVKECQGQFQDALAILSDLITAQAVEVDLSHVIFKAAVVLKHIGSNNAQAIEYLEFLMDDPPISEGYTKTHVLAFLAAIFEQSGDHYSVLLEKTYVDLQENYMKDLSSGKNPVTNQKKLNGMLKKKGMSQSSEIFELLGLQAVDRCEYVLAAEMIYQAVLKAPNKGKLQHVLAEIYFQLGEREKCKRVAEKAFLLVPQSAELRNLLLTVNPEKWTEKIRSVAPVQESFVDEFVDNPKKVDKKAKAAGGEHWLSKANNALLVGAATFLGAGPKSAEQKAKEAVEKEKKRLEKRMAKEKASAEAAKASREANVQAQTRKRDPAVDGPARPIKPQVTEEATKLIDLLREGNKNIFLYDPHLRQFAAIRDAVEADERAWVERKARMIAAEKAAKAAADKSAKK